MKRAVLITLLASPHLVHGAAAGTHNQKNGAIKPEHVGSAGALAMVAQTGKPPFTTIMEELAYNERNCPAEGYYANTIRALRGMLHNHSKDIQERADKSIQLGKGCCPIIRYIAGNNDYYLRIAYAALKQTPPDGMPLVCNNGSACRVLIDTSKKDKIPSCSYCLSYHQPIDAPKKYETLYCSYCKGYHRPTDYCRCPCYTEPTQPCHGNHECKQHEQTARLMIDVLCQEPTRHEQDALDAAYCQQKEQECQALETDMDELLQLPQSVEEDIVVLDPVPDLIKSKKRVPHRLKPRALKKQVKIAS